MVSFIIVLGYALVELNSSYRIIDKVNKWSSTSIILLRIAIMESVSVGLGQVGGLIGCITNGFAVSVGRRNLMLILGCCLIGGVVLTLIGNYPCFLLGRLFKGICCGMYTSLCPLYCISFYIIVREISPVEISGILGSFFVISVSFF